VKAGQPSLERAQARQRRDVKNKPTIAAAT